LDSIAKYAIEASRETTETVKWVFGIATGVLTVAVGFLSWIGWQSLNHVVESVKTTANARITDALADLEKKGASQLAVVEQRMLEHLQACNIVCVNSLETIRLVVLAEGWNDTSQAQRSSFREALKSVLLVQQHAKEIKGLERSYLWALGMEAYISVKLGMYDAALAAQLKVMEVVPPERAQTEYEFQYNLACYLVRTGYLDDAVEPLRQAIGIGGEEARISAWREEDLRGLRESQAHSGRLAPIMGARPPPMDA